MQIMKNLYRQLGKIYITGANNSFYPNDFYLKEKNKNLDFYHHFIEHMGDISEAIEYNPFVLNGYIEKNVNYKDIDKKRIITREELAQMPLDKYSEQEEFIHELLNLGNIMSQREAEQRFNSGELIWVDDYYRDDGTHVSGYFRRK